MVDNPPDVCPDEPSLLLSVRSHGCSETPQLFVMFSSLGSINARNGRGGFPKNYSVPVQKGFSVRVFKGPTLYPAATTKANLSYRPPSSSNVWRHSDWSPSDTKKTLPSRALLDFPPHFFDVASEDHYLYQSEVPGPSSNYSIYPSASKDTFIYERSLCSKSDTYTETDAPSEIVPSPSSYSTTLSNDSTATLHSMAPTPSLVSDSTTEACTTHLPATHIRGPNFEHALSSSRGDRTASKTPAPIIRPQTPGPVIKLSTSICPEDETSASTDPTIGRSSTLSYSSDHATTPDSASHFESLYSTALSDIVPARATRSGRDLPINAPPGIALPRSDGNFKRPSESRQRGTQHMRVPRIMSPPSPPHENGQSSYHIFLPQELYSTSATRASSPQEDLENRFRTSSLGSVPQPRYIDEFISKPHADNPVVPGGRADSTATTSRMFSNQNQALWASREAHDDPVSGSSGQAARDAAMRRPQTPFIPSGPNPNDRRAGSFDGEDVHHSPGRNNLYIRTSPAHQADAPQGTRLDRMASSSGGRNPRSLPVPPILRGDLGNTANRQDPLDLAERGESPPIESTGGSASTQVDANVAHQFVPATRAPLDPRGSAGYTSAPVGDLHSYSSRDFRDRPEPQQLPQIGKGPEERNSSFSQISQQLRSSVSRRQASTRPDPGERRDVHHASRQESGPLLSSYAENLTSKDGNISSTGNRDAHASSIRENPIRQETSRDVHTRQGLRRGYSSSFVTSSQPGRDNIDGGSFPLQTNGDLSERPDPHVVASSTSRAAYRYDTWPDTDIDEQQILSQNLPRHPIPSRGDLWAQKHSRPALQPLEIPKVFEELKGSSLRSAQPAGQRCVRWDANLIAPSPIFPSQRRKGWFNRRGDQLWMNDGSYRPPPVGQEYPPDLDSYPEHGQGWQNEEGVRINMRHRLIPKLPLRSALKRPRNQELGFEASLTTGI